MKTRVVVRLDAEELAALDAEVSEGRATSRSDAVHRALARLPRGRRYREEEAILIELVRRGEAIYPDLDGLLAP